MFVCTTCDKEITQMYNYTVVFGYGFLVQQTATGGFSGLNLPDVCTNSPVHGKAFCPDHCALLGREAPDVPTDLHKFLKFCGSKANCLSISFTLVCLYLHLN